MIIILFVINVMGFSPNIQFKNEQEISLYPTIGENYEFYLSYLKQPQLTCKMHPEISNVKLKNQCEEIYREKGNEFISVSSNNTHFSTLANKNEITLYKWQNSKIQQVGESVTINSTFNCFNINLSKRFSILVDCYQNNKFFLIQLIDAQQIIAYTIQSTIPSSTKIQSIVNGTNAFIVYAQYFKKYSIISLLSSQYLNSSSLNNQFVDFDIPNTISPNIYAITSSEIYQFQISPDSQFFIQYTFSQSGMNNFNAINTFYNLWSYSQCDQIQLSYLYHSKSMTAPLIGCEKLIVKTGIGLPTQSGQPIQKILQSEQFVVYQSFDAIMISQQRTKEHFSYQLNHSNTSLLYFNQDNELFSFNQDIIVYQITHPFIQVNLTNFEIAGNNHTLQLICQSIVQENCTYTYSNFYLQVLPQNDTNIYVMFDQDFPQYQTSLDYQASNYFYSFSGQLLNYTQNQDEPYFNVEKITFQNVGKIIQSYQLVQIFSLNYPFVKKQYLIGYSNESLDFLYCYYSNQNNSYQFTTLSSINISVDAKSLQLAYSIQPEMILCGLNTNDTIYLFQSQNNSNIYDITQSNYTLEQQFSDFVITYNSIIILILNQEIKIMTLNFTNTLSLNQESINNLFSNIQFNPIQIVVNTQLQQSLLYINNINEVIIISIAQNSFPIPMSLIKVNFKIKQINLVNQLLILSYICNNKQNICFSVWNVQNLPNYYYLKNLYSVQFDNNIIIQSDNLFFYVTFSNYTVYVYNPQLPYHMSLYNMLQLTSPIQCSEQYYLSLDFLDVKSIIISNSNVYFLLGVQGFSLTSQQFNQDFNNSISYPQFTYNYTVTSALNQTSIQQTPNQSITLYSDFTVFQNQSNISIHLTKDYIIPQSKNFTYPMNLILDRQVSYCQITNHNEQNDQAQYCELTQLSYNSTNISNFQNYSLITSINNEFFSLQNNFYIQTVTSDLDNKFNLNYQFLMLSECLKSSSYNYTLFSICQNSTSQYLLSFTLNAKGEILTLNAKQLPQTFVNISKIGNIFNQLFIQGTLKTTQQLYWFDQSSNTFQNISNGCNDFSIQQIQLNSLEDNYTQQIMIFYVWANNVNYTIMSIEDKNIKFSDTVIENIYYCNQQTICMPDQSNAYLQILIIQIYYYNAIILVSDTQISYLINVRIKKLQYLNQNNEEGKILRTIPNYININNTSNSFYKNGVLMQQFPIQNDQNQSQFIIGVYYLNNLQDENLLEPIFVQGSFNTTISNYAMIVNQQYQNGTSLYIYNQSIYTYSISTWNITCLIYTKNSSMHVQLFCQNEFQNGTYDVTFFLPPKFRFNFSSSVYALFLIIFLLLLYFYFKVKQKTRNFEYISSEIEL